MPVTVFIRSFFEGRQASPTEYRESASIYRISRASDHRKVADRTDAK